MNRKSKSIEIWVGHIKFCFVDRKDMDENLPKAIAWVERLQKKQQEAE